MDAFFQGTASSALYQPPQRPGRYLSEIGLSVALDAERYDVLERMGVFFLAVLGFGEPPDGDDVVDVRVASDLVAGLPADDAFVVVSFEGILPKFVPTAPIGLVAPSLPIRMPFARERLGQPRATTGFAAEHDVTNEAARVPLDGGATNYALASNLATGPSWMCRSTNHWWHLPRFVFDAIGAEPTDFLRGVVLEGGSTDLTFGDVLSPSKVWIRRTLERDRFLPTFLGTVLSGVVLVERLAAVRACPIG